MDTREQEKIGRNYTSAFRAYVKRRNKIRTYLVAFRRAWRQLLFLYLRVGLKGERIPAEEAIPVLRGLSRGSCSIQSEMEDAFKEYTSIVSYEGWPLSFESACLLWSLCQASSPKRILDLGSGFSSFVFRRYSLTAEIKLEVWSVDEDKDWLEKTRGFLKSHNLTDENLLYWGDYRELEWGSFDLIFLDLEDIEERSNIFEKLLASLNPEGLIVLDDMHNSKYRTEIYRRLELHGCARAYSIRWLTLDKFLRYCLLVQRHSEV